jgi:hypothetical protein
VLFALWSFAGLGDAYGRFVIAVATPIVEPLTDCRVAEVRSVEKGLSIDISRTDPSDGRVYTRTVPLQPREVFSGLIPFLALILATAAMPWRRRVRAVAVGVAILFVFHLGLMLLGPYLTGLPQAHLAPETIRGVVKPTINVLYGFYGIVCYAALPFLLWFWLGVGSRESGVGGRE